MANKGWIKLHRQMLDWEWGQDSHAFALFARLLLMANNEDGWRYRGVTYKAGQVITTTRKLCKLTGLTIKVLRNRLDWLERSGELTVEGIHQTYTLITINNYAYYQDLTYEPSRAQQGQMQITETHIPYTQYANTEGTAGAQQGHSFWQTKGTAEGTVGAQLTPMIQSKLMGIIEILGHSMGHTEGTLEGTISRIYNILSSNDKKKNNYIESIINTLSQNLQNAENAQVDAQAENTEVQEKPAPKKAEPSTELEQQFEEFRKAYKGRKRGHKEEFENFKKKNTDWREIVPLLMPALQRLEEYNAAAMAAGKWVPQWANLQTWINQRRWTEELPVEAAPSSQQPKAPTPPTGDDYAWQDFGSIDK